MLDFVARVFRGLINILLWLILIGCIIGGFVAGGMVLGGGDFNFGYAFLGLIAGGLIGFITIILSGGLIANFLNMVDNIQLLKNKYIGNDIVSNNKITQNKNIGKNIENPDAIWKCPKCNGGNPNTTFVCNNCGYKLA